MRRNPLEHTRQRFSKNQPSRHIFHVFQYTPERVSLQKVHVVRLQHCDIQFFCLFGEKMTLSRQNSCFPFHNLGGKDAHHEKYGLIDKSPSPLQPRFGRIIAGSNRQIHDFSGLVTRKRERSRPLVEELFTQPFASFHVPGLRVPGLQLGK